MKVAVVGGGIYGITVSTKLAKSGHDVTLFEKNDDILKAASGINQFRIHRGYHYPRSIETIKSCQDSVGEFEELYKEAVIKTVDHYYAISNKDSLTSFSEFRKVCEQISDSFEKVELDIINSDAVEGVMKVDENLLNPSKLKEICWERLNQSNVKVVLNKEVSNGDLDLYDNVVICTYSRSSSLAGNEIPGDKHIEFEICEKIVVDLPIEYRNKSVVVMDGPFMCIDPYGDTGHFLMGNVVHAKHEGNIGREPVISEKYAPLLNNGIIHNPEITKFEMFIESAGRYFKNIHKAKHVGSMFTIRAVLPRHLNKNDNRPVIVERTSKNTINVFSGKLSNCVQAADKVLRIISE